MVMMRWICPLLALGTLGGCALAPVKPWERELLAKPEMQSNGYQADNIVDDHIYFSREASNGGRGFAGGGCGCN